MFPVSANSFLTEWLRKFFSYRENAFSERDKTIMTVFSPSESVSVLLIFICSGSYWLPVLLLVLWTSPADAWDCSVSQIIATDVKWL